MEFIFLEKTPLCPQDVVRRCIKKLPGTHNRPEEARGNSKKSAARPLMPAEGVRLFGPRAGHYPEQA